MDKSDKLMYKGITDQEGIAKYGYYFNELGILKSLTDPAFKYKSSTQKGFEQLAEEIIIFVQKKVLVEKLDMKIDSGITLQDYVYYTNDFFTNQKGCLVMIQGSGSVRPGYNIK